jgi:hypothetical protein
MSSVPDALHCPLCDAPIDNRDLNVRFTWPDPVLRAPEEDRRHLHEGHDIITVPTVGAFARVLLTVQLTNGYRITYGTWLGLTGEAAYDDAVRLWHDPDYPSLRLTGVLANAIEPWGPPLMSRARAVVRDPNSVPHVEAFAAANVREVITDVWPGAWVISAVPDDIWECH